MATDRWLRMRALFEAALELEPPARAALLDRECASDADMRRDIEELLEADSSWDEATRFLDVSPADALLSRDRARTLVGQVIGGFEVLRAIGSGGMGAVYEAVQHNPHRRVALKVMRRGLLDGAAVRRFRYESEILARLKHPGIAQVHASGTHRDGDQSLPFFAMELVEDGRDLVDYAAHHGLDLEARVRLMIEVCDAVRYGHVKGVIHRDLKPANILVDGSGAVRIIDFGVARCTDADVEGLTLQTRTGLVLGTLQFMSPEQVSGLRDEVDTRSDVYSLGVILYQLLTGALPHDLTGRSIPEAARIICEDDPPPPERHDRRLRGDLATIIGKAMARERDHRYGSAAELGADLHNYLADQPITARPPSTFYQVRKFARRHSTTVVGAVALLLLLVVGSVAVSIQNVQVQRQAEIAERARRDARTVVGYLRGILGEAEAIRGKGPDYTVREALDAAAGRIDAELADQPEVEAELRETIGVTYMRLSLYEQAERHLERFAELARTLGGDLPFRAGAALARLRAQQDRLPEAVELASETIRVAEAAFGAGHLRTLEVRHDHGRFLAEQEQFAAAESELREVLAARRAQLGATDPETLATQFELGRLLCTAGDKAEEADRLLQDALQGRLQQLGADHVDTLLTRVACGDVQRIRGDLTAADASYRAAHAGLLGKLGADHRFVLDAAFKVVRVEAMRGRLRDVFPLARETLERCENVLGDRHRHTQRLFRMVGGIHLERGELEQGVTLFRRAYRTSVEDKGPDHRETLTCGCDLAYALQAAGEVDACLRLVDRLSANPGCQGGRLESQLWMVRGLCQMRREEFAAAEKSLLRNHEMCVRGLGPDSYEVRGAVQTLIALYRSWKKPKAVEEYEARLQAIDAARAGR